MAATDDEDEWEYEYDEEETEVNTPPSAYCLDLT